MEDRVSRISHHTLQTIAYLKKWSRRSNGIQGKYGTQRVHCIVRNPCDPRPRYCIRVRSVSDLSYLPSTPRRTLRHTFAVEILFWGFHEAYVVLRVGLNVRM